MTPQECAVEAVRSFARGASAVHVHPRDTDGRETFDPDAVAATVAAIRSACPELPVGVSTREPIEPDLARRIAAIRGWTVLPDFASVNVHEPGADAVAGALHERGIGVEAGIWTVDAARAWRAWRVPALRILLECMEESAEGAVANARAMLEVIGPSARPRQHGEGLPHDEGTPTRSVLLHGEGPATWAVLREAVALGLDTRIGLEDPPMLPDGSPTHDNAAMVAAAVAVGAT
jgi:uncharacterized protein (DUF849 family)